MLLGFISLLLTVFQDRIGKICISEKQAGQWLPCDAKKKKKMNNYKSTIHARLLADSDSAYCSGKVSTYPLDCSCICIDLDLHHYRYLSLSFTFFNQSFFYFLLSCGMAWHGTPPGGHSQSALVWTETVSPILFIRSGLWEPHRPSPSLPALSHKFSNYIYNYNYEAF